MSTERVLVADAASSAGLAPAGREASAEVSAAAIGEAGGGGATEATSKKVIAAAVIGNWLEFFDFTVFGFFAITIGKLYFPSSDPTTSLLLSVGTFAVGFFTRPIGSVVLGIYADRRGRKAGLNLTILLMAFSTVAISLTPTYAQIGVAAPVIIVLARLLQGFSQGGEFGAATTTLVERGSARNRGFRASWQLASQGGAALLGSGTAATLATLLPVDAMNSWGWRIPFLMGFLIAPVGVYLRRSLPDDTHTQHHAAFGGDVLGELLRHHKKTMLLITLAVMGGTVSTYILTFYMPTYAIHTLGLPQKLSMWIGVASGLTLLIMCPLFGWWSDRLGRRKLPIFIGRLTLVAMLYPAFWLFNAFPSLGVIMPFTALMMVFYSMGSAPQFALMSESFPKQVRATGISVAYALSVTIFGGTAQLVATWLIKVTGNNLAPAWYVGGCILLSLIAVGQLQETAGKALD